MEQKDLIKNLTYLEKIIQPQKEWKQGLRVQLLSKLDLSGRTATSNGAGLFIIKESTSGLMRRFAFSFSRVLQPAIITLALIGFIGINSLGLAMAKNSLPGSLLYNYKKINEKITLKLIQNTERKISLKASFANQRLVELNELVKKGKGEETILLVNNFQENLNDISVSFSQISQGGKTEDLIRLAFILDAQTAEYEKILNQTKKETSLTKEATEKVKTALMQSDQASTQALKAVIGKYEDKESKIDKDKLVLRLEDKIKRTEDNLIDLGDLPIQDNKAVEGARKSLAQAKEYLAEGSFSMALDKIEESKKIAQGENNIIDEANNTKNNQENLLPAPQDDNKAKEILEPATNNNANKILIPTRKAKEPEANEIRTNDFQTGLIKENKIQEGFFGGLIKSKK